MRASGAGSPGRALRRAATMTLAAGVAAFVAAAPAAQPATAAPSSWDTTRTEEFSRDTLPKGCTAYSGAYKGGKSVWTKEGVRLDGGLLRLRLIKKTAAAGFPYVSGGVGCWDWAQQYGRFEVRAKVPRGRGIDSYITLMPSKGGQPQGWTGIELLAPGPETAYITNGFGTGAETARVPGTYSDGFHTYVVEWAPNLVRITVDKEVVYTSTKSYKGKRWLGLVVSNGDALTGVPDAATKLPAEFEIDYMRTATFTGVAPVVKPTGQPAAAPRPSATAVAGAGALKVPATTPAVAPAAATADEDDGTALAGGVWPWLLGGSMIAGLAVVSLSYPRGRRHQSAEIRQPRRGMRRRPDDSGELATQPPDAGPTPDAPDADDDAAPGPTTDDDFWRTPVR